MLLREADIPPIPEVIESGLGPDVYMVYQQLMKIITDEFSLNADWNYYKDGKAWLCKISFKKKTVLWLSVWEKMIKISFYFTGKTIAGLLETDINNDIKNALHEPKTIGKLIPLTLDIVSPEQLPDFSRILVYKKNLK